MHDLLKIIAAAVVLLLTIFLGLICLALTASAQIVPNQNQLIPSAYWGQGVVISTSTSPTHKLGAVATSSLGLAPSFSVTYPLQYLANVISLAFGTTTSNTWAGTQTFTNSPVFTSLTGGLVASNPSTDTLYNTTATTSVSCAGLASCTSFTALGAAPITITATGDGAGTVSTSSSETATRVPFWTSTAATPALLSGGNAGFTFNNTDTRLTATNASTTAFSSSYASSTNAFFGSLSLTTPLTVPNGGTGTTTMRDTGVLFYNSSLGTLSQAPNVVGNALNYDYTNGRLGIGTTTPGYTLGVHGNASFGGTVSNRRKTDIDTDGLFTFYSSNNTLVDYFTLQNGSITAAGQGLCQQYNMSSSTSATAGLYFAGAQICGVSEGDYTTAANALAGLSFYTSSVPGTILERLRIDNEGDVGIGSTTPYAKLTVQNATANPTAIFEDQANDTTPVKIDASGNLGIGTTSPSANHSLAVAGGAYIGGNLTATGTLSVLGTATSTFSGPVQATCFTIDGSTCITGGSGSNYFTNAGSATYLSTGSFLGVGTTSPFTQLSIGGNSYLGGNLTATGTITFSGLSDGLVRATSGVLAGAGTISNADWSGTDLSVANGGTGLSTCASNRLITGNGTSALVCEANATFDAATNLFTTVNASTTRMSASYASSTSAFFGTLTLPNLATPAGSFLAVNASGQVIATTTPSSTASSTLKAFTASTSPTTTWSKPTGLRYVVLKVIGKGGAGGSPSGGSQEGAGGGGGGYCERLVPAASLGATETVTVSGTVGISSSFGSWCSASSGSNGGVDSAGTGTAGGAGGTGTSGDINLTGQQGDYAQYTGANNRISGGGGDAPMGFGLGGARVIGTSPTNGLPGTGCGGGGSGGDGAAGSSTGGTGATGCVYIYEYY